MKTLKTKYHSHKLAFIAIVVAIVAALGVGAFFTTKAIADNNKYATFHVKVNVSTGGAEGHSIFEDSKIYFVTSDGVTQEAKFDSRGEAYFVHAPLGAHDYKNGFEPFVFGGFGNCNGKEYCIETTPISEFISHNHLINVDAKECKHIKINNVRGSNSMHDPDFQQSDSKFIYSMDSQTITSNSISVPEGSSIKFELNKKDPSKVDCILGYQDKYIYSFILSSESGNGIHHLTISGNNQLKAINNIIEDKTVNVDCSPIRIPIKNYQINNQTDQSIRFCWFSYVSKYDYNVEFEEKLDFDVAGNSTLNYKPHKATITPVGPCVDKSEFTYCLDDPLHSDYLYFLLTSKTPINPNCKIYNTVKINFTSTVGSDRPDTIIPTYELVYDPSLGYGNWDN